VQTEDEAARILGDQMPFHFRDPTGPLIDDYIRNAPGARFSPDVLRHFAINDYGGIDVVDWLPEVTHPVLILSGRHDRTCPVGAGEEMAKLLPDAEFVVFEESAHMTFVEENDRYLDAVRRFLDRVSD
jgi:pimeloyl-ACP methyl ester carboxylesterase